MWNLKRINFTNLFSHKESCYEFLDGKCVIISGENRSDRSLDNNGAGKTTLFEAIAIALTNESLRNIKKDDFINRDAEDCCVDLLLFNPVLNSKLRIVRRFHRTKSVKVELWENGILNSQIVSVNEANKRVFELIGVSREDLLRYYIISQDNAYTFFTASDVEKKEVMNRITQASMIQPLISKLNDDKLSIMGKLGGLESKLCNYETKNQTLLEQKNYIIENNDKSSLISKLESDISDSEKELSDCENNLKIKNKEIEIISEKISSLESVDILSLYDRRNDLDTKLEEQDKVLMEDRQIHRNIKAELDSTIKCPECGFEFINKSYLGLSVEEAKDLLKQTDKHIEETNKKKDKIQKQLYSLDKEIIEAKKLNKKREELDLNRRHLKQDVDILKKKISQEKKMISEYNEDIKKLREEDSTSKHLKKIEEDIANNSIIIEDIKKQIKPIEEDLDMVRFWIFNLGKNGFTTYLANKSVKTIEGITNSFLKKFGVELSVLINGFKILKSGDVREKIEVFVSNDGINAEAFMSKSGGERSRVTLAGILGIQQLINNSLGGRGLDFLALDEAISGVDSRGTMEIIKTLDCCGKTVMMITQNIEDSTICSNVLRVVKDRGVSKYELNKV
jgi:DNA repair exonuclease SbcCD ATPase subunit